MELARERNLQASTLPPDPALNLQSGAPDTTSWAPKRVSAYLASLVADDTPSALLRIPSLNLTVPVYDGTTEWMLNRGVGRVAGTAAFESEGNLGIAGHRDGFFRPLRNIRSGDLLYLDTTIATIRYRVVRTSIVAPTDLSVLDATSGRTVTLITCYPFYYIGPAPQRFIVQAVQVDGSTVTD